MFDLKIKRMGTIRFSFILISSIISIITLIYQTYEYLQDSCGCGENVPEIIAAFKEYSSILGIPISFIGFSSMTIVLVQIVMLSYIPNPMYVHFKQEKILIINDKRIKNWYFLLLIQLGLMCLAVVNLIFIELVIIKSVCVFCTISQGVILLNTFLIYNWTPKALKKDPIKFK